MSFKGIILCLCDRTGNFAEPWVTFGYTAVLVDPQHTSFGDRPGYVQVPATVLEALDVIKFFISTGRVEFVVGFPPCTDVAVSGARWWQEKREADPYFQARAAIVAEQCRMIGELSGAPWIIENPVSAFSSILGDPDFIFHPYEFNKYEQNDNYTKTTCLWCGNGFVMPRPERQGGIPKPDNRIFTASPSEDRGDVRAVTPLGFARAVFLANAPELKVQDGSKL